MFNPFATFIDRVTLSMDSLADNRRRTIVSLLGITIGIAAVISVGTVSRSANGVVYAELESFGLSSIWVSRDYRSTDPDKRVRHGSGITTQDYQTLVKRCCPSVLAITAIIRGYGDVRVQHRNRFASVDVRGADVAHLQVVNDAISRGRYFRPTDIQRKSRVAVLAPKAKQELFGTDNAAVGQTIRVNGERFVVIGLLADKSRDFLSSIGSVRNDANRRVLIPYTRYQALFATDDVSFLQAKSVSLGSADQAGQEVISMLSRIARNRFDYRNETMRGYIQTADRILGTVELVGIIAASISLLVGGMGIANIMSTAVVERTREIGLRKAIGARNADVRWQFLLEAGLVSLIGGILGTILGLALVLLLSNMTGIKAVDTVPISLLALFCAMLVGVLAGYLPAQRAARLDPVTALRFE